MKILKRIAIVSSVVLFIAIISFVSLFIYEDSFRKREIYREMCPSDEFEFVLYQVGSPEWPFGPVKAQIRVINSKGKTVDKESISIHNDGAEVSVYDIKEIRWFDTMLELDCTGRTEHSIATYTLEFE